MSKTRQIDKVQYSKTLILSLQMVRHLEYVVQIFKTTSMFPGFIIVLEDLIWAHGFLVFFFCSYSTTCCPSSALILTARRQPSVASKSWPGASL